MEDEPVLQRFITEYLVAADYVVQTAVDGLDAITKLRAGLPELIISDLRMPRMDGFEFLHVMRKRFPQIPILLMGDEAPDAWPEGVASDAYFQKNKFGLHQLPEVVSELAGRLQPRPAPPPVDTEPAQAKWGENGQYVLSCGDCLREFSFSRTPDIVRDEKWATCVHCGRLVQFLVAGHSEGK